jgi:Helix-turn-helix domain
MDTKEKAVPPEKETAYKTILATFPGNSSASQRNRIVEALNRWPITTFEMMRHLDVYYPPSRVKELRDRGYTIETLWTRINTEANKLHRVGLYVLTKGAGNE